ncbi:hypothetical protein [Paenisporosarcina cavernae]|uniref:hypothetical protein n=1 Tax=Paenisporosarcina cavernae TaxID=2320858 RepID=UPI0013C47E6C|nr:hypothetical protein [Paenisporosarcina cavernae]
MNRLQDLIKQVEQLEKILEIRFLQEKVALTKSYYTRNDGIYVRVLVENKQKIC